MQMSKTLRSVVSLCVTLAMLVSMLAVFGAFPVSAAKAVEKFTANFSALPTGTVSMTDTATVEYLEERFAFFYFQEGWYMERADVNGYVMDASGNYLVGKTAGMSYHTDIAGKKAGASNSEYVDGTGNSGNGSFGISRWLVNGKYIAATAYSKADAKPFRKVNSMWVKAADGDLAVLDNFALEMDFKPADSTLYSTIGKNTDSVAVYFRAKTAGQGYGVADHQVVSLAPDGGLFVGDLEANFTATAYPETMQYNGAAVTFDRTKDYHLSMTVIGTALKVTVTNNGTTVYELTRTIGDMEAGYLGIGGSNAGAYYGNIEITRLDKDGNPVDFNDHNDGYGFGAGFARITDYRQKLTQNASGSWSWWSNGTYFRDNGANVKWLDVVEYDSNTYDFSNPTTYAADQAVVDYLDDHFNFYYNRESTVTQFATPYENSVTQDADAQYGAGKTAQWKLQDGRYLNAVFTAQGNEILRKTVSLVPKNSDGEEVTATNVETEFDMNLSTTAKTGLAFTFRAATAGKLTSGWKTSVGDKVTVIFTATGWQVYEGVMPKDDCVTPVVNAWADGASVTRAHVYIKAVGNALLMTVTGVDGTVYYSGTTELTYTAEGKMFYSVLNGTGGFANIRTNRLNDDGTVAAWDTPTSLKVSFTSANGNLSTTSADYANVTKAFNAYYDADGTLTQTAWALDGSHGVFNYIYGKRIQCNGGKYSNANANAYLQYVKTLSPKTADGKEAVLKNFELSFTTYWANITYNHGGVGAIVIGLRQPTAGKFTTGAGTLVKDQGLIMISPDGITFAGGNDITDDMYYMYNAEEFATRLNPAPSASGAAYDSTLYTVKVRVVGNDATVTIGNNTYKGTINYTEAGYLSFGVGGSKSDFGNISVTRLDDFGNPIDWNADQYQAIPTTVTNAGGHLLGFNTTYANKYPNNSTAILLDNTSLTVAQREEFLTFMNNRFDVYYNDNDGTYIAEDSVAGNTIGYNYDEMMYFKHNWLRPNAAASGYGEIKTNALEDIGSLVFKDDDGEQLYFKNLEINTAFEQEGTSAIGSNLIAIRQKTPGRYFNADGSLADGTFVQFSNGYVYVYENGVKIHEQYCAAAKPASVMTVKLRVVGNQLTYTLTSQYNSGGPYTGTVTLSTADSGYVAFSQNNWRQFYSLSATSVTALDDLGQETPIKKPASTHTNGNVAVSTTVKDGVYTNTITVTPNEGYELLAGSLIATDVNGDKYVPVRVGFREGGDASQYVVKCASPVKVSAVFYAPTTADPNVGNLGTSINEELAGLRFISRLARFEEEGTEYVTLDGKTFPVSDYGMLVALKSTLGTDTLSLDLAETNKYVKKLSVKDAGVYYDVCDSYVDMSVCITGVDSVVGGVDLEVVARPYAIAKDENGDDVILYAKSFDSTYAENAGLSTVTFSEMENDGVVKVLGRADVVGDDLQMDWVNTGFEVKGTLTGSVKVNLSSTRTDSLLNVSVDGKAPTIVHVPNGTSTVTLAKNLSKGEHTIRVESGTSVRQGTLNAASLQFLGELSANSNEQSRLKIEVLGDSISCGWGLDGDNSMSTSTLSVAEQVAISNSYYSYAAQTARLLDADLQVVAQCAQTIPAVHGFFPNLNKRSGTPKWDFENNQQDIVIINLGTNDEWQGTGLNNANYTAEKSLANIKALLTDVREAYPDAYIIYVYGMMRKTYEPQYQQAINEMNDDKAFYVDMTAYKSTDGFDGNHPKRDSHTAVANALASFIRTNCPDLFGHTTHTETMTALTNNNTALFTDRTEADGTARRMTYSNTGMTIEGYLYGELKMNVNVASNVCALNVIVDGDVQNATTVWVEAGNHEVTLLSDLRRGYHTIEIVKGTAHHAGTLLMKDLTYTGTLTTPTEKALQFEFIGDSVTVGEGMYGAIEPLAKSYNAIDGYAAQVANYFGAGVTTVAQCGAKIPGMTTQYNAMQDGEKDIVVINLGTNDFGWSSLSGLDIANDYYPSGTTNIKIKDAITGLIDDVRAKQPDAYIIWTYGMMFTQHGDALADLIAEYATATGDEKLLYCDLSAAQDNTGKSSHPSTIGNNNAAILLASFITENCADVVSVTPTVEKTYATDRVLKVACVGDSITAGGYWNNNLGGELSTDNYAVSGFGVSGSTALFKGVDYLNATTNAGKAYVDQAAYTNALAYGADAVVVMLGTNDSKKVNWPYYADEFIDNYTEIVRSFQEADGNPMVFIALPPTVYSTGSFQDISNTRIENFIIPALKVVAARTGAVIVDTHTPTGGNSSLMSDGVHPNADGKAVLCETIAAAIIADTGRA